MNRKPFAPLFVSIPGPVWGTASELVVDVDDKGFYCDSTPVSFGPYLRAAISLAKRTQCRVNVNAVGFGYLSIEPNDFDCA